MMKCLMSYLQTNHYVDYRKILHDAQALKTLPPQILSNLQNILNNEMVAQDNQENATIGVFSEKNIMDTCSETEAHNKSNSLSTAPLETPMDKTPMKENAIDLQKKKWWTPKEVTKKKQIF